MKIHRLDRILRSILGLVLLVGLVFGTAAPAAAAGIIYVDDTATGAGTGISWLDAYTNLQTALGAASAGDQIWVAAGTYKPDAGTNRLATFTLKNGVGIYGGFSGTETLLADRDPSANLTTLSGEIGDPGLITDNSYHVVTGSGTDSTTVLDGFTITAGYADGSNPDDRGAGNLNISGNPTLANLIINNNTALGNSGGGAGMYNENSAPALTNIIFSGNQANDSFGGAMFNKTTSAPTMHNVIFSGNSANQGGGVVNAAASNAVFTNVMFINNIAHADGGAVWNYTSSPTLTNVTFYNNSATSGAAISNTASAPSLINTTFKGNIAATGLGSPGGAMANVSTSNPTIVNSILYGDTGGEIYNDAGSTITITFSIVQGGHSGTGNLDVNPLLRPLQDNGGFAQTLVPAFGSPAIDAGDNSACPPTDQRGSTRPLDGNGDGVSNCDMGAAEATIAFIISIGAQDGSILETTEFSSRGGTANSAGGAFALGDDALNRQYRALLSFDTSALPAGAVIQTARLKIKRVRIVGVSPFTTHRNLVVDVRTGSFAGDSTLQARDFQALPTVKGALTVPTSSTRWYSASFPPATLAYINKAGLTQLRLRFQLDDDNDFSADYIQFFSSDAANPVNRPVLVIEYYIAS